MVVKSSSCSYRFLLIATFAISTLVSYSEESDQNFIPTQNGAKSASNEAARSTSVDSNEPIAILWGLPDEGAIVGKLFQYTVPRNAFKGHVALYKVKDATGEGLPQWLSWDSKTDTLIGVPQRSDAGTHFILVEAIGKPINETHASMASDIFSITVLEEAPTSAALSKIVSGSAEEASPDEASKKKPAMCAQDEPMLTYALVLDGELNTLDPIARGALMTKASEVLKVPLGALRLVDRPYINSLKRELLLAGPGDGMVKNKLGELILQWQIGCGTQIPSGLMDHITDFENLATGGKIRESIGGLGVISWNVASVRLEPRRRKRQYGYVTPTPAPTRPGIVPEPIWPSGTIAPIPTTTVPIEVVTEEAPTTPDPLAATIRSRTTRETQVPIATQPPTTPPIHVAKQPDDSPPRIINSIGTLVCYIGVVCTHHIERDVFYDEEDGDTTKLDLSFNPIGHSYSNFMHFDQSKLTLTGFSLRNASSYEFALTAMDHNNGVVADALMIRLDPLFDEMVEKYNHYFKLTIDGDFETFAKDPMKIVEFLNRLSGFFADPTAEFMTIHAIRKGSVIIEWSNNTLPRHSCAKDSVNAIKNKMVKSDGTLRPKFRNYMRPFSVTKMTSELSANCLPKKLPGDDETVVAKSGVGSGGTSKNKGPAKERVDDTFVTTIVPIVVIVALLFLAALIACLLYRSSRKKKSAASSPDHDTRKNEAYLSKGAPVVFPDEIDQEEEKEPNVTSPMLLKDERPPLAAPDYGETRNGGKGLESFKSRTPPRGSSEEGEEMTERGRLLQNDSAALLSSGQNPLYRPPPPIDSPRDHSNRSPRPKHHSTPQQAHQPPILQP